MSDSGTEKGGQILERVKVALHTGGGDKHYALGLARALIRNGTQLDIIGSEAVDSPEFHDGSQVTFLNLLGGRKMNTGLLAKALRVMFAYFALVRYALVTEARIFHILWNFKLPVFDRIILFPFYKVLGKKLFITAHNINEGQRNSNDSFVNRLSLKIQYCATDHIFVHTEAMKQELSSDFGIRPEKVSVVRYGLNDAVPVTSLTTAEAKRRLNLPQTAKTMLFFGNIAAYKGLAYLVDAFHSLATVNSEYRLIIAGRPKAGENTWISIHDSISRGPSREHILQRIEFIPDEDAEIYFKAADVLVLPYTHIFQSGVLFLGYSFGLPVIVSDVGSLKEDVIEGKTGFVVKAADSRGLASAIIRYFSSDLYLKLEERRGEIREWASARHSWDEVATVTLRSYASALR